MDIENILDLIRDKVDEEEEDQEILDFVSDDEGDLDALEPPVELDESFPNTVFICNVPKVTQEKHQRLSLILGKHTNNCGPNTLYMPINPETGCTDGFAIVTYEDAQAVANCMRNVNNIPFDKKHVLKVFKLDDFDLVTSREAEFQKERRVANFSRTDFRQWLTDKKCREQLLLRYQAETEIYWHDTMAGMPVLCYGGEREKSRGLIWCDWRVQWSPQGSYLATFHKQGIALWAGPDFEKKVRLPKEPVVNLQFSPNEEYAMLWNGALPPSTNDIYPADKEAYSVYHILTGKCVKTFRTPAFTPSGEEFPHFLWSPDGKYFAEYEADKRESYIIVWDTKDFEVLANDRGEGAIRLSSTSNFQWSPKDNILAVWTEEKDNNPARLALIEIPSRRELASRSRTQCEATMQWHSEGDYLCLIVAKLVKTKQTKKEVDKKTKKQTNLEIFRIRESGIPVDTITINNRIRGFFWEKRGSRFAVITEDEDNQRPRLMIYQLSPDKVEEVVNFDLPSNSFNNLFWAPDGQYFVVAATSRGQKQESGDLLFAGLTHDNRLEILFKDEQYALNTVEWDPSSRFVITAVTQEHDTSQNAYRNSMEAGYAIRTFQGRVLHRAQKEKLYQVAWRPHPESLLPQNQQKHIKKNIKQYSKKYDAMDDQAKEVARQAFKRDREEKTQGFLDVLDRLNEYKRDREEENSWDEAVETFAEEQGWMQNDQVIEEELDVTEELISG